MTTQLAQTKVSDLTKLSKKINKHTDAAIQFLVDLVNDKEADKKLRKEAAVAILDKNIEINKEQTKVALAMLMVDQRKQLKVVGDENTTGPRVIADFTKVHKVEGMDTNELDDDDVFNMDDISEIEPNS